MDTLLHWWGFSNPFPLNIFLIKSSMMLSETSLLLKEAKRYALIITHLYLHISKLKILQEKVDLQIGQILAYGALLRSGRITDEDVILVANQFLKGSEIKKYIQPVAFGFLNDLLCDVSVYIF